MHNDRMQAMLARDPNGAAAMMATQNATALQLDARRVLPPLAHRIEQPPSRAS
jgi:hypothetical protein